MGIKNNGSHCQSHFSYIHKLPTSFAKLVAGWLDVFYFADRELIGSGETRGKGKPVLVVEDSDDDGEGEEGGEEGEEGGEEGEGEDGEAMAVPGALSQPQKWTWEETLRKLGARRRR